LACYTTRCSWRGECMCAWVRVRCVCHPDKRRWLLCSNARASDGYRDNRVSNEMLRSAGRDTCHSTPLRFTSHSVARCLSSSYRVNETWGAVGCACRTRRTEYFYFEKRATVCVPFGDGKQLKTMRCDPARARVCVCVREREKI